MSEPTNDRSDKSSGSDPSDPSDPSGGSGGSGGSGRPADGNQPGAAAAAAPVPERLLLPVPAVSPAVSATPPAWTVPRAWMLAGLALAASGFVASGLLWQKLGNIQEELARRSADSGSQAIEARALARQAQESAAEQLGRITVLESRLSEVSLQRSQLEELMQSLSRSRDENLVIDIDSGLRLAQQQAELTGSAEPLLAALRSADQRLSRAAQPRLNPLQRAIAKDMDRLKAASLTDVPLLLVKLDELARMADELPVANALAGGAIGMPAAPAPARPASAPRPGASAAPAGLPFDRLALGEWSRQFARKLREEAGKLLRVSRIDQPEAALLSPEQSFFLRENFKLRLMNARLALLSRQTDSARADLVSASGWLNRYFDLSSRRTQNAVQALAQVQGQLKTSQLPRLDDTLSALATAAAGR